MTQPVHRSFYPTSKGPSPVARGVRGIPRSSPLVEASPIIDARGVRLEFLERDRYWTPEEVKGLARWLFSLAHEAETLAQEGLISEHSGYDVIEGKVISLSGR